MVCSDIIQFLNFFVYEEIDLDHGEKSLQMIADLNHMCKVICNQEKAIAHFMGPASSPFLAYLTGRTGQITDAIKRIEIQQKRLAWIASASEKMIVEIETINCPTWDGVLYSLLRNIATERRYYFATYIQAGWRQRYHRKAYLRIRNAIIAIQKAYHRYKGCKFAKRQLFSLRYDRQNDCATMIQTHFRAYLGRKFVRNMPKPIGYLSSTQDYGNISDGSNF